MSEQLFFDVASASIFSLGRELISDGSQAVMELVKNCFDADATFANVEIVGDGAPPQGSHFPEAQGYIRIRDDGDGMTLDQLRRGWFTIALSEKKKFKEQGLATLRGRTPLGDKGLGRLGAQALADNVEITTCPRGGTHEIHAWFSWNEFMSEKPLSSISIRYEIRENSAAAQGTTILLSNLRPIADWTSKDAQIPLQRSLSRLISPFKAISEFRVVVRLNGILIDLIEGASDIRSHAVTRCVFMFDGRNLDVEYFAKLAYCRSSGGNNKNSEDQRVIDELFDAFVEHDNGAALLAYMDTRNPRGFKVRPFHGRADESWLVRCTRRFHIDDIPGLIHVKKDDEAGEGVSFSNPGPFEGEIDNFILDWRLPGGVPPEVKGRIKDIGGLRVFRNGFGIQLEEDWLGTGRKISSGHDAYEVRLPNILGYVALTAKDNAQLSETSDRQRFNYDTVYFKNFRALLLHVLSQMGAFQSAMKVETRKFLREIDEQQHGVIAGEKDQDIITKHRVLTERVGASAHKLATIQNELNRSESLALRRAMQPTQMSILPENHPAARTGNEAESKAIRAAEQVIADLMNDLKGIAELRRILEERMANHQRQIELSYETILTGISMEVFAHEIANVADRLLHWSSSNAVVSSIRVPGNGELRKYVDNVKSQSAMIQRQLVYITPAMRFVRDRKDSVLVHDLLTEVVSYHAERLSRNQISLNYTENSASEQLRVLMNKGRFHQIMDNLLLNSEYWIRHWMAYGRIPSGSISIAVVGSRVEISDNGPGVDPALLESIFEPFVSGKPAGDGRGIGLFVVRQLLSSQGCSIALLPLLNPNGRRFIFSINLQGVVHHVK